MTKLFIKGTVMAAALVGAAAVQAFSLLGPFETWQTAGIGYAPGGQSLQWTSEGDSGAPKGISGEFRIAEPIITYGFDTTFLDYFGPDGVAAVEEAFALFNALPAASAMSADLSEFPLAASRVNYAAQRLNLIDVKTVTMGLIMEQLCVASPERYVWTIRQNNPDVNGNPRFLVVRRNFDPVTHLASSFVNNTLYTYYNEVFFNQDGSVLYYDANEISLDASEPNVSLAAYVGNQVTTVDGRVSRQIGFSSLGVFYTGLTRDDAGALRYIYHPDNQNQQPLTPQTTLRTPQNVTVIGSGSSTWGGLTPAIGFGAGGGTNALAPVGDAVRGGLDKVTYIRVDTDPLLNRFRRPVVLRYTDTFTTNGVTRQQVVERTLGLPHFYFVAQDMGTRDAPAPPVPWVYGRGFPGFVTSPLGFGSNLPKEAAAGPGIAENATISAGFFFNTIGPGLIGGLGATEESSLATFVWGKFDGTTNAPKVFPAGQFKLSDLERAALGGN